MRKKQLLFIVFLGVLVSCSTVRGKNYKDYEPMMYGMVYDGKDISIGEVRVYVDGELKALSDMRGRFILKFYCNKIKKEINEKFMGKLKEPVKHKLRLEKKGYEPVESEVFYDPMSLLYFRMHSAQELIKKAEEDIEQGNYENGERIANKVAEIEGYKLDGIFLKAIIKLKQKDKKGAVDLLNSIEDKDNYYVKKFLEQIK